MNLLHPPGLGRSDCDQIDPNLLAGLHQRHCLTRVPRKPIFQGNRLPLQVIKREGFVLAKVEGHLEEVQAVVFAAHFYYNIECLVELLHFEWRYFDVGKIDLPVWLEFIEVKVLDYSLGIQSNRFISRKSIAPDQPISPCSFIKLKRLCKVIKVSLLILVLRGPTRHFKGGLEHRTV